MHLFGITQDATRLGVVTPLVFTYRFLAVVIYHTHISLNLLNSVLHIRWMGKMHSDGSFNKTESEKTVFGFLRRKRRGKLHISPEVDEFERLTSLPSPHKSPLPICWNTPVKIRNYYLSKSTAQLLPPPLPVKIMAQIQNRSSDLTINTDTADDTEAPSKQDADFVLSAVFNSSPSGFENQKAKPLRSGVSLHKSRSMGAIRDKARPFELNPMRNGLVKPEHSLTQAKKSADSLSKSSLDDGLDHEELLQAEYNKLFQIGRERGYNDDDVRQWVDYILEHGLPDLKTASDMDSEITETEVDCNKARVPEFTQRDPAVKEIERHYLQDVFGEDTVSTRQLLVDNQYTSDELAVSPGPHAIYLHGNSDIASHTTLKAYCRDTMSSSSSFAASHSFHLAAPEIEQNDLADNCGSDYRSATADADPVWFRADMDRDEFRDSSDTGFKAKDTVAQEQELKVMGTRTIESTPHQGAFKTSKMTDRRLYPGTHRTPNGLIPLLLPLRYNKEKLHDDGQSSSLNRHPGLKTSSSMEHREEGNLVQATGRSAPFNRKWKEQLSEATATLANLADRPTSTDSYADQCYDSLINSLEDKQSEATDLSGVASEVSTSYSDSPTLGYAHLSTPSATLQDIYTPTSSRSHPRSLPSFSPCANDKMKMPHKNVGPGKLKVSPRNVSLPSPCGTFSESSFNSRRRESTVSTKWDEEMRYANEKVSSHDYMTRLPGSY